MACLDKQPNMDNTWLGATHDARAALGKTPDGQISGSQPFLRRHAVIPTIRPEYLQ